MILREKIERERLRCWSDMVAMVMLSPQRALIIDKVNIAHS